MEILGFGRDKGNRTLRNVQGNSVRRAREKILFELSGKKYVEKNLDLSIICSLKIKC
jgi:hypothetical protein